MSNVSVVHSNAVDEYVYSNSSKHKSYKQKGLRQNMFFITKANSRSFKLKNRFINLSSGLQRPLFYSVVVFVVADNDDNSGTSIKPIENVL